jgi:diacylglycerol O-acyltransferase / wax synthase
VSNPDRLSGLDASFLDLEGEVAHMHVAACAVLEGPAPSYEQLIDALESRLHLIPRYRQRLAFVPLSQGRPVWVDDPQFRLPFHVRHTALPKPGSDAQLKRLAGRIFSQALDRTRPLWELWMVEGLSDGRFALLTKTHHALVDGENIASVLFDRSPTTTVAEPAPPAWVAKPLPSGAQLLANALIERATSRGEVRRTADHLLRTTRRAASTLSSAVTSISGVTLPGSLTTPSSPYNVPIGPHRRFTWVRTELEDLREIKNVLGGTVNDVVLAAIAGALGVHMRRHEHPTDGVVLRALVPISVNSGEPESSGNELAAMWAPLPVGITDPATRLAAITEATAGIKDTGHALGAAQITDLSGFAPPTLVAHAVRLQASQDPFNLVVTNVPGPQSPMYFSGRKLEALYSLVPLAENNALGIAVMSYNGAVNFSLNADYDELPDLEDLADDVSAAVTELAQAAARSHAARAAQ